MENPLEPHECFCLVISFKLSGLTFISKVSFPSKVTSSSSTKNILCLFCLSVCPFLSNKRQHGWTNWTQILCVGLHMSLGKVYKWSKFQNLSPKFNFHKIWKFHKIFLQNPQLFFIFVLQCIQKENVHYWNIRWAP